MMNMWEIVLVVVGADLQMLRLHIFIRIHSSGINRTKWPISTSADLGFTVNVHIFHLAGLWCNSMGQCRTVRALQCSNFY